MVKKRTNPVIAEEGVCDCCGHDGKVYFLKNSQEYLCMECLQAGNEIPDIESQQPIPNFEDLNPIK
jgi:hypothetical protein